MIITTFVETLDGSWIYYYTCYILGRTPRTKNTLPDFCENTDPDKWVTTVWYRVIRDSQEFRGLTVCQRNPRVLGRHIRIIKEDPEPTIFNNLWIQVCRMYYSIIILNVLT